MYVVGQGNSSPKNTNKFCFVTDVPLPAAPPAARKLFVTLRSLWKDTSKSSGAAGAGTGTASTA